MDHIWFSFNRAKIGEPDDMRVRSFCGAVEMGIAVTSASLRGNDETIHDGCCVECSIAARAEDRIFSGVEKNHDPIVDRQIGAMVVSLKTRLRFSSYKEKSVVAASAEIPGGVAYAAFAADVSDKVQIVIRATAI